MSALQAALLIAVVATGAGVLSCDTPRDPPKIPKPVTATVATGMPGPAHVDAT